jgi:RNA polymerase sigma-70 factor (ECF subfamily)
MASGGDGAAKEQIVYAYSPLVDRWCRRRCLRADEVQVIGQEVFLSLFKKLGDFRKEKPEHSFRKWLCTIAKNKVNDYLRRLRDEPRCVGGSANHGIILTLPDPTPPSEDEGEPTGHDDYQILVHRCLEIVKSEFEPRTYEAFWAVVMEEKAPGDVARSLGMSVGSVYTAKSRVTKRLHGLLSDLGEHTQEP